MGGISGGIYSPNFMVYLRATVIKTEWFWHKPERVEDPDMSTHGHNPLIFDKDTKITR